MDSVQLAGVALAALLSENFILVNCLGIGTRVEAFHSTTAARRTGPEPEPGHGGHRIFYLVFGLSGAPAFWVGCICAPWSSPSLPSSLSSCCERQPVSGRSSPIESTPTWPRYPPTVRCWVRPIWPPSALHPVPGPHLRPVRRPGRPGGPDELRRPAGGDQPHQLPPALPRPGPSRW